jgi:hypothetical protein
MEKRTWMYILPPAQYEIACDICAGANIAWSEWEHMIWCYDCQKDMPGTPGVFGGPIALGVMEMLGLSLDRIDLATGQRSTPKVVDGRIVYVAVGEVADSGAH